MYRILCGAAITAALMLVTNSASADHFGSQRLGVRGNCYAPGSSVHYKPLTLGQVRGIGYGVPIGRYPQVQHRHYHRPPTHYRPSAYYRSPNCVRIYGGYYPLNSPYYSRNYYGYRNYYRPGVQFGVRTPGFGLQLGF